uniref:FAD-dependent monooxygenase n=1 Tax=Nonomuraea pusilla TaxID=46177 RepID=UPI000AACE6E0|nr:FAD-dependent monooxygenase [Nonomuraea pusilla]
MKIACVGGGPASLYFSILMKRMSPSEDITVYERDPVGSTYGWGVTYSDRLLGNLYSADQESACAIAESSASWNRWDHHREDVAMTTRPGHAGYGISRRRLLSILAQRARVLGVRIQYEREITDEGELAEADLIVAGDGVNSALRNRHADHFGTQVTAGRNVYLWLGTTRVFEFFTFAFKETVHGWIWCYGYPYDPGHSTCVVECSPETWKGLGFDRGTEADTLARLEKIFAGMLDGHPLMGRGDGEGSAHWLNFRTVDNRTWYRDNVVLIGDAAHTTHYSIGAGTGLALGDAATLVNALLEDPRLPSALAAYEKEAKAALRTARLAGRRSARWYENIRRYAGLPPEQMFKLHRARYSLLLPYVPPRLYYWAGRVNEKSLARATGWVAGKVARARETFTPQ